MKKIAEAVLGFVLFVVLLVYAFSDAFAQDGKICFMTSENIYPAYYEEPTIVIDEGDHFKAYFYKSGAVMAISPKLTKSPTKPELHALFGSGDGFRFSKGIKELDGYYGVRYEADPKKAFFISCR